MPLQILQSLMDIFQFTLPCGERHTFIENGTLAISISIHAPVWGATSMYKVKPYNIDISIHAPVWGATSSAAFS